MAKGEYALGDTYRGDRSHAVYTISVAAEIVGAGVQTLRTYEDRGLVHPVRTPGGTRRYSNGDIERLKRIIALLGNGLNLAGITMVLDLQDENARLRARGKGAKMTEEKRNYSAEVPEEDLKDQLTPASPLDEEDRLKPLNDAHSLVSEGDWIDQQVSVPLDDPDETSA